METPGVEDGPTPTRVNESARSRSVTATLANPRGRSRAPAVASLATAPPAHLGELVARAIEATAASPEWRDRVRLGDGFAEDAARKLAELLHGHADQSDDASAGSH